MDPILHELRNSILALEKNRNATADDLARIYTRLDALERKSFQKHGKPEVVDTAWEAEAKSRNEAYGCRSVSDVSGLEAKSGMQPKEERAERIYDIITGEIPDRDFVKLPEEALMRGIRKAMNEFYNGPTYTDRIRDLEDEIVRLNGELSKKDQSYQTVETLSNMYDEALTKIRDIVNSGTLTNPFGDFS